MGSLFVLVGARPYTFNFLDAKEKLEHHILMQSRDAVLQAEKEIDEAFASSSLAQLPYSQAAWTLLSMNEDAYRPYLMHEIGISLRMFSA